MIVAFPAEDDDEKSKMPCRPSATLAGFTVIVAFAALDVPMNEMYPPEFPLGLLASTLSVPPLQVNVALPALELPRNCSQPGPKPPTSAPLTVILLKAALELL